MALGRIVSALVDARTPFYPNWFYFIVEAAAAAALFSVGLNTSKPTFRAPKLREERAKTSSSRT